MSRFYSLFCLAFFLPTIVHAEVSYDQFLRAVESGGEGVNRTVSHRLAQAPESEASLPAPAAKPADLNEPAAVPSLIAPGTNAEPPVTNAPSEILSVPDGAPQPTPMAQPAPIAQPVPMSGPVPHAAPTFDAAAPATVDFNQVFAAEEFGPSQAAGCGCQAGPAASAPVAQGYPASGCGAGGCHAGGCECRSCGVMSYYTPNLPPSSSFRGYFNASPCVANVWDGYASEAAAECAKFQYRLAGPQTAQAPCCTGH